MSKIPNDANLDDYKSPGIYSLDNYKVDSLWNMWAPLIIFTSTATVTQQIITDFEGRRYIAVRRYTGNPQAWSSWDVFSNTGKLSDLKTTNKDSIVAALNELYAKLSEISKVSSYFPTSDNVKVSGITNSRIYKNDITRMRTWAGRMTLKAGTYLAGEILCNIGACEYSLRIPCQTSNGTNIILTYQKEGDVIINSTTTLNAEIDIIINISMPLK